MPNPHRYFNQGRRGIPNYQYYGNSIYKQIASRLYNRHKIRIADHINVMEKIGTRLGQGIEFEPIDGGNLKNLLKMPKFAHDNRKHLCDLVAAGATKGEGYREIGVPSLHIQVAPTLCKIHIDNFGFVAIGPDGQKYYNPDLVQHIVDELFWEDKFVGWVSTKNQTLGGFLGRIHPVLPNSRNRYKLDFGGRFDVKKGKGWSLGLEATRGLSGENKVMGKIEVYEF